MNDKPIAVILFQLGGPDSLESVEPFLYNLFCDPDIIDFPGAFLARKPLAKFIATRRSQKVAHHYKEVGGKSPILELTTAQANALQSELDKHINAVVHIAMRYWHPLTEEVILQLKEKKYKKIILLPLYPQYSKTTTGSSINEWNRQCAKHHYTALPTSAIQHYHDHPLYIEAIVERINETYQKFSGVNVENINLVFSAHGLPISIIQAGDPYQKHIEETVKHVVGKGNWKSPHVLCYQSKVGPSEWLKPSLTQTLRDLASRGRKHILIVPIAFVTEHIETLHEINIETREDAVHLGIKHFEMTPALNNHPKFIQCLVQLVLSHA